MALLCEKSDKLSKLSILLLLGLLVSSKDITEVQSIGVCNGRIGNDLPPEKDVVEIYKANSIGRMRVYDPNQATLEALKGTNIELVLGVPNSDLQSLSSDPNAATQWVKKNVKDYSDVRFRYIAVGNEVDPNTESAKFAEFVLPAMKNIHSAISAAGLKDKVKVSTSTYSGLMGQSSPPSQGSFKDNVKPFIEPIISFLASNQAPLLVNIYTYFAYIGNTKEIQLSYALLSSKDQTVWDGSSGYSNLFDAMLDATYSAVEKAGGQGVDIVVSETGWPSDGGDAATTDNAKTYYKNLIEHVKKGTPKKPGKAIETYLFAMFDENQKDGAPSEKHFGLFLPNKQSKYQLTFNQSAQELVNN